MRSTGFERPGEGVKSAVFEKPAEVEISAVALVEEPIGQAVEESSVVDDVSVVQAATIDEEAKSVEVDESAVCEKGVNVGVVALVEEPIVLGLLAVEGSVVEDDAVNEEVKAVEDITPTKLVAVVDEPPVGKDIPEVSVIEEPTVAEEPIIKGEKVPFVE